jgi:hypothetical protein
MKGKELLDYYTNKRDFTGSNDDNYAQELMTIYSNIGEQIFHLLEQAEIEAKKLAVKKAPKGLEFRQDFITIDDIILV